MPFTFPSSANPIPVKWAAWRMGLIKSPHCRPPLAELDPTFYNDVESALEGAGLLDFGALDDVKMRAVVYAGNKSSSPSDSKPMSP